MFFAFPSLCLQRSFFMSTLTEIRHQKPLILSLTNSVTIQRVADLVSFLGASPLMSSEKDEIKDLLTLASVLVLNTGTLSQEDVPLFIVAGRLANEKGIPVVLDPVAVHVPYRAKIMKQLLSEIHFDIIRGNASEIAWFAEEQEKSKGIDSLATTISSNNAKSAAKKTNAVIVQTGQTDVITDGNHLHYVKTSSKLFEINVGCGDMLTAAIATFSATNSHLLEASYEATKFFSESGIQAERQVKGLPGDFITALLNNIYCSSKKAGLRK